MARIVKRESSEHMERVLRDFPPPPLEGGKIFSYMILLNTLRYLLGLTCFICMLQWSSEKRLFIHGAIKWLKKPK